jgi:SpoVK/Ycf46/Vps4 family AAA+-type ATPase
MSASEPTESTPIFLEKDPGVDLRHIILPEETRRRLNRVIQENRSRDILARHGLLPRRRLLFYGPPGTGKTFGGEAMAGELGVPFHIFNLESLASSGSQSALQTLAKAFDYINHHNGVFLFDEFDAIAANRSSQNSSGGGGDSRRIVNDLLIHFETFTGEALLICATNFLACIDGAFRRRFDTICYFPLPNEAERKEILERTLALWDFKPKAIEIEAVVKATSALSLHETEEVAKNAAKTALIHGTPLSLTEELRGIIDRKDAFRTNFEKDA